MLFRCRFVAFLVTLIAALGQRKGWAASAVVVIGFAVWRTSAVSAIAVRGMLRLLTLILLLRLGRAHDPIVMLGVLQVILGHYAVACRIRITRQLQIFFVDMRG